VQTLSQLQSGQLQGTKHLKLSQGLTTFPLEILTLADSLETLDLSNNLLSSLPVEISQLHRLKIIFASNNKFTVLPQALGQCPNLEMVGFKSNAITQVPQLSLPKKLRWLILTDNKITSLPDSLGERTLLQKLALAGNALTELPLNMSKLVNLELIRISANQLTQCPEQLLKLPKLAWFAFSGNPFCRSNEVINTVQQFSSKSFKLHEVLGQGASGVISRATWNEPQSLFPAEIAVKIFKGSVTSDGYPQDELNACLKVGNHPNLVQSLAQVNENDCLALIMNLIPAHFKNLGLPPTLKTCTRDTFENGYSLSFSKIQKIVTQMIDVFKHLHSNKVCHGDLYAHNTLVDKEANIIFGDFGAASMYHMLSDDQQESIVQIEQRALAHFIDDLLNVCDDLESESADLLRQLCQHNTA